MRQLLTFSCLVTLFLASCSPAPEPEPVDDVKNIGDLFEQLDEALDEVEGINLGADCPELDDYGAIVDDYVLVLEEFALHGEASAEFVAKKLDLEKRAQAFGDEFAAKQEMAPSCAMRLLEIQLKFAGAAAEVLAGNEELLELLNSPEFQQQVQEVEEALKAAETE